ncbi:MAG: amino acid adenylation domain-containing protein [Saprospiraceae bacterium]|nr:MAG: amino acid adenylation domain-containing protein [Saprospiraceae bacterium]
MGDYNQISNEITFPGDVCLHHLFERQAAQRPEATALVFGEQSMSYAEMNRRADALAQQLVDMGIQTEDFVALHLERSFHLMVAVFAVLKAGGAYVPIDVDYPKERLAYMVNDAGAKVILTQSWLAGNLPETKARIIFLDKNTGAAPAVTLPPGRTNPRNLAYMIYTSGSTGKPKGVMITHENVCFQLQGQQAIAPQPIGAMMLTCSISFDVSVLTFFWPLLQGAPLVLPKQGDEKDMARLADTIFNNKVTHVLTLPSPYTLLLEQAPAAKLQSLRLVNVSGEVCPTSLAQKHELIVPGCQLYNLYGPTEATVNCTFFKFPKGFAADKVPIGLPILNYEIFILDEKLNEVAPGEVGEIYIGGTRPVVGRGYWHRPELTAQRFISRPAQLVKQPWQGGATPDQLYKTGDLARWMPDGNVEFLGRSDFQVKFRGFRVELGEIETAISRHPAVKETVVILQNQHEVHRQRLVAYLTLHPGQNLTVSELRHHLEQGLPEYMLPSHFVFLKKMPLTTNGKFDRQALPEPANERPALDQAFEAPQNPLEREIAHIWEALLFVKPVGRLDKFFELGGNSILAAKFIGELMTACSASIFITTIFDYPTVAGYAAFLEKNYPEAVAKIAGPAKGGSPSTGNPQPKLSPAQIESFKKIIPNHLPGPISKIKNPSSPIFILAPPRSGTTLLRVMLAGHPSLFACNELQLLHFETLKERSAAYTGKFSLWSEGLIRAVMELKHCEANEAKLLLRDMEQQGVTTRGMFEKLHEWAGGRTLVDKSPSYALDAAALKKAVADFPKARFIQLVRHPYSMVRSFEKYHMDQVLYLHPHDFSPRQLGELVWLESQKTTEAFFETLPEGQKFTLLYEDLVTRPEEAMRQMCEKLGLEFHPGLLHPYEDLDKKMTSGIYKDSRSMGDTNFDQQKGINAKKATGWEGVFDDDFLCSDTWKMVEKFGYPTSRHSGTPIHQFTNSPTHQLTNPPDIAIVGMACRLPGANDIFEFWQNLVSGKDVSHEVSDDDLAAEGVTPGTGHYVRRTYALDNPYAFDASFFGYLPKEAEMTDPQHRIFLETAYEALESAGYNPFEFEGNIGIFGGVARNLYFHKNVATHPELLEAAGGYQEMLAAESSFSVTRVAYKLNLRGPAVNVQTACSTGGVGIHLACQSLRSGDSDMVIVGGGRVQPPVYGGYEYVEGGPLSPDGYIRAFDAGAGGMAQGNGMAMLVLKKLDRALADGDRVWAVIKATAINNDGAAKTGITAPSSQGQAAVIAKALENAGLTADQTGYIETHGTGTFIGDPIEMQGLTEAFRKTTKQKQFCPIGSVKTNVGHLDAGACVVGIIKMALSLYYEKLPPSLHFQKPNAQIDFANSPFFVNATLREWPRSGVPRRTGVSTFGLGGTNVHVILEEAPAESCRQPVASAAPQLLLLSAKKEEALERMNHRLEVFLEKHADTPLASAAYTLATGRPHFQKRMAIIAGAAPGPVFSKPITNSEVLIPGAGFIFMFPGGGAQYANMARDLYASNTFFAGQVEACFAILQKQHGLSIKEVVYPTGGGTAEGSSITSPSYALASLFSIEYSLAKLWQHWGIEPAEMIGHSMGEYTAACLSGVMSLEAALGLVTVRGKLFETLSGNGCMLSVALTEEKLRPFLTGEHTISVINKVDNLVVSGTADAIDSLQAQLEKDGVECSKIHIAVAAHSPQVEPVLEKFREYLETVILAEPKIPFVSNVTGTWITAAQATSVDYWISHLRQTVRFDDGLATLMKNENRIFLEAGPGQTLSSFARMHRSKKPGHQVFASVRHPKEPANDVAFILKTLGKLWVAGVPVDWHSFYSGASHRHVPLPAYSFEKKKYFIAPRHDAAAIEQEAHALAASTNFTSSITAPPAEPAFGHPSNMETMQKTPSRLALLLDEIKASLHELSGMEPADMDENASFLELGFDSLFLSQAVISLNQKFGTELSFRMLFEETPAIGALAQHLDGVLPPDKFRPEAPAIIQSFAPPAPAAAVPPPAAMNTQPGQLPQLPVFAAGNGVQQLMQQQLNIMQQQLNMLTGQAPAVTVQVPVPAPPIAQQNKNAVSPLVAAREEQEAVIKRSTSGVTAKLNSYKTINSNDDLTEQQRKGLQDFMARYEAMTKTSKAMQQRHREVYADPRGATGFSKLWKEICYQIGHEKSKGSKIWDVDGNEYIDYVMSYGVALFGHMPDFVEEAVAAALKSGNSLDVLPPKSTEIARIICKLSGMDRATLANTGTEAVLGAVRAARTATGKDKIAVFDTDYHGMIDQFMVRGVHFKDTTKALPSSPGVPRFLVENTLVLDYDDPNMLKKLETNIKDLAAVVIEPVQAQNPHWQHPALIKKVRELTAKHGVALIFDEIINGFRLSQRGAQDWYGVDADIVAYGKSISGGLPLAAIAGKAKFMSAFDGGLWQYGDDSSPEGVIAYFAGTFIKNPLSVAASYAALTEIERRGVALQADLNESTATFANRIREIFLRTKAPLMIQSCASIFMIKTADNNPFTRMFNYFLRYRGVNIRERPCFISTAHTTEDFERTCKAFELAIADMFGTGLIQPWEGEDLNVIIPPKAPAKTWKAPQPLTAAVAKSCPLTEGQQEIFLASQLSDEASKAYNIATEIRLEGPFDAQRMTAVLQALVQRHESLRTVFEPDGESMRILPALNIEVPFVDIGTLPETEQLAALEKLYDEEAEHKFDLFNGPLVRFKIVRQHDDLHLVFIHVHHIICDGWSLGILTRETGEMYGSDTARLAEARQLSDYAADQAALHELDVFKKNEEYWLSQFSDQVPVLELPTDYPRPPVKTHHGAVEKLSFDAPTTARLRKAAARQGTTFYVFMLAAYSAFLARITGQHDLVLGIAAAGHTLPGNQNLVAHAIGMLPVRTKMDGDSGFGEYLKTVRRQVLDAFDHQQYTFGALVKKLKIARNASRNTLVSVAFNLDSPLDDLKFGRLKASTKAIPRHYETFDAFINLKPLGDRVDFEWNFNSDLFRRETIRQRLAEFETFLTALVDGGEEPLVSKSLLPEAAAQLLDEFSKGEKADFPLHLTLHQLFENQVEKTPGKSAVVFDGQSLTYAGLNRRANALARHLAKNGMAPGAFAAICMERSLDVLVSIYGVLKAGGAYVPIDPHNPKERVRLILEDSGCTHLLTNMGALEQLPEFSGVTLVVDELDLSADLPNPDTQAASGRPAYIIYTSGSTGTPKGVAIRHSSAVNTLHAINRYLEVGEKDTVYSVSSMAFDMSIPDYFLTMMTGATLVLAGEETKKDGFALREEMELCRPTIMQATPATWKILLLSGWEGDENLTAVAGGEGFSKELARQMMERCKAVWNGYGPTETTIYATYQHITEEHLRNAPGEFAAIGRPIANVEVAVLDAHQMPVPPGVPGELYIGGPGMAEGYLNRPALTAEKFVTLPSGKKYYRSGDLVRYLPGGEIEFLGRIDGQVKIRGYRVELGEIEETMKQFGGIRQGAVKVIGDNAGHQRLAGYVVMEAGATLYEDSLKDFLRSKIPDYMVPSVFVTMDSLPMNTAMKVDRNALAAPDLAGLSATVFEAPSTPKEKLLASIWQELLGVEKVGVNDDFFELGGHSLAAVSLMSKIKEATGHKLPLTVLFQHPTLRKLAALLGTKNGSVKNGSGSKPRFTSLIPIREGGSKPALYLVHGGGLHVLFYQNLVKFLDEDQPIYALQAKGLNGGEEPLDSIEDMAAHYIQEILAQNPDGPYNLAGYSLGGLIAWEMAKQLQDMGREVPVLALFDSVAKYEWAGEGNSGKWKKKLKKAGYNLSLMVKDPAKAIEYKSHVVKMQLQHMAGKLRTAYRNNETNEIEEGYLPYGKQVYEKSLEAYEKYDLKPLDVHVDLFKAKEQMFYLADPVYYGWDKFARQGVIVHEIQGNHLTLFDEIHGKEVAGALQQRLGEASSSLITQ